MLCGVEPLNCCVACAVQVPSAELSHFHERWMPIRNSTYTFIERWAKLLESIAHIHYNLISSSDCAVESSKHY